MCDKATGTCPFVFDFISHRHKIQEICVKVVSNEPFCAKIDIKSKK